MPVRTAPPDLVSLGSATPRLARAGHRRPTSRRRREKVGTEKVGTCSFGARVGNGVEMPPEDLALTDGHRRDLAVQADVVEHIDALGDPGVGNPSGRCARVELGPDARCVRQLQRRAVQPHHAVALPRFHMVAAEPGGQFEQPPVQLDEGRGLELATGVGEGGGIGHRKLLEALSVQGLEDRLHFLGIDRLQSCCTASASASLEQSSAATGA